MAALALGLLGSSLGAAGSFLSIAGGIIGSAVGGWIDQQLFGPKIPDGPRLDNLAFQGTSYGTFLGRVHGTVRMAGTVIWAPPLIEEKVKVSSGGKGGASQKVYKYYANAAVVVAEGSVDVLTCWADKKVIYDISADAEENIARFKGCADVRVYKGGEDQLPDGLMVSVDGIDLTPAYRGMTVVVFERMALEDYGNRLPNLEFEVSKGAETFSLAQVARGDWPEGNPSYLSGGGPHRLADRTIAGSMVVSANDEGDSKFRLVRWAADGKTVQAVHDSTWQGYTGNQPGVTSTVDSTGTKVAACTPNAVCVFDLETGVSAGADLPGGSAHSIVFMPNGHIVVTGLGGTWAYDKVGGTLNLVAEIGSTIAFDERFLTVVDGEIFAFNTTSTTGKLTMRLRKLEWNALDGYSWSPLITGPVIPYTGTSISGAFIVSIGGGRVLSMWWKNVSGRNVLWGQVQKVSAASYTADSEIVEMDDANAFSIVGTRAIPIGSGRVAIIGGGKYAEFGYSNGNLAVVRQAVAIPPASGQYLATELYGGTTSNGSILAYAGYGGLVIFSAYAKNKYTTLAAILAEEFQRVGLTPGDYDVSDLEGDTLWGFVIGSASSARQVAEPLQTVVPFDLIESGGIIKVVRRKSVVAMEIDDDMIGTGEGPAYDIERVPDADIPRSLTLEFQNVDDDYQTGAQTAYRSAAGTDAQTQVKNSIPCAISSSTGLQIAQRSLHTAANEKLNIKFTAPRPYAELEPGDLLGWRGFPLRLTKCISAGTRVEIEGTPAYIPAYSSDAIVADRPRPRPPLTLPSPSTITVLELPALRATEDVPGIYYAVQGGKDWPGADILRSTDSVTWTTVASTGIEALSGTVELPMRKGPTDLWDEANTLVVQLSSDTLGLSSVSADTLLSSEVNMALVGQEIIQFRTAQLVGDKLWELSGLLRGRHGTEHAIDIHQGNEPFFLLDAATINFLPVDVTTALGYAQYRAITLGLEGDQGATVEVQAGLETVLPLSPVHIRGHRAADGGLAVSWVRRARVNAAWLDRIDTPLDEATEAYEVVVYDGGTVKRRTTVSAPSWTYTAALQTADFGSLQASIDMTIAQVSSRAGPGATAPATL